MMNKRKVFYLKDYFRNHFLGGRESINILMSKLSNPNSDKTDMSGYILDLKDVIINQEMEQLFYEWIRNYNLDVVDTTMEYPTNVWNEELQKFETIEEPIYFRQHALIEKKREIERLRIMEENNILKFYVEDPIKRKKAFTKESAKKIVDIINKRIQSGNRRKLVLSIKDVNKEDLDSVKEIAAFLISTVDYIEINEIDTHSQTSVYGILPAISQLCYDFSTGEKAWEDIKKKHPVGSEFYFSPKPEIYLKAKVIRNIVTNEKGEDLASKFPLTEEERENYYSMEVQYIGYNSRKGIEEPVIEKIISNSIQSREILIFPTSIFEGGKSDGHPTSEELIRNVANSKITKRESKVIRNNDSLLLNDGSIVDNKDIDWIHTYRKLMKRHFDRAGVEIPKIDLMKIVRGAPSPFKGIYKDVTKPMVEQNLNTEYLGENK